MGKDSAHTSKDGAKMGQDGLKMGSRWAKMGPSRGHEPRWDQDVANLAAKDGRVQGNRTPPEWYSSRVVPIFDMGQDGPGGGQF